MRGLLNSQVWSYVLFMVLLSGTSAQALVPPQKIIEPETAIKKMNNPATKREVFAMYPEVKQNHAKAHFMFDFPVTYNARVKFWIKYFQTNGRKWFQTWLERSPKYLNEIQTLLKEEGLPQDLAYVAMIESGFSNGAKSTANAVGMWQFIKATGTRYGLRNNWWLDERRDFNKATRAAIRYKKDLYQLFGSWHLVAASYNTGENRIRRLIQKNGTNDFWRLADKGTLSNETMNYVPKIIAATLIAKAPALYGFKNLKYELPLKYEIVSVPGGTNLQDLAQFLGVRESYLKELNPDLLLGYIPESVASHKIKVPAGSSRFIGQYSSKKMVSINN